MNLRFPVRAGTFYESAPAPCRHHATKLLESAVVPADLPERLYGGLVPHAGWTYSGRLAARTFKSLARRPLDTVVLLGADHVGVVRRGEVFDSGVWQTPLGEVAVNEELAAAILKGSDLLRSNPAAHQDEHSLEVQVPLLQALNPRVRIVPVAVPPTAAAAAIGEAIGRVLAEGAERFAGVFVVGSTDLTHHGGHFPSPGGRGETGRDWTVRNDRRMLDLVAAMKAEEIVEEATRNGNACGAGAIAATIAACRAMGATRGLCLEYTNSYDVVHALYPYELDDTTVGYASVVFA
jgi:AmmeMemoRadiSam system protein B